VAALRARGPRRARAGAPDPREEDTTENVRRLLRRDAKGFKDLDEMSERLVTDLEDLEGGDASAESPAPGAPAPAAAPAASPFAPAPAASPFGSAPAAAPPASPFGSAPAAPAPASPFGSAPASPAPASPFGSAPAAPAPAAGGAPAASPFGSPAGKGAGSPFAPPAGGGGAGAGGSPFGGAVSPFQQSAPEAEVPEAVEAEPWYYFYKYISITQIVIAVSFTLIIGLMISTFFFVLDSGGISYNDQ